MSKTRIEDSDFEPVVGLLLDLSMMIRGGCPIGKDDIPIDWWMALGIIADERTRVLGR